MNKTSIIKKMNLLISAMLRSCLNNKSTYEQQVKKYNLNKLEQKELLELLIDMGHQNV